MRGHQHTATSSVSRDGEKGGAEHTKGDLAPKSEKGVRHLPVRSRDTNARAQTVVAAAAAAATAAAATAAATTTCGNKEHICHWNVPPTERLGG